MHIPLIYFYHLHQCRISTDDSIYSLLSLSFYIFVSIKYIEELKIMTVELKQDTAMELITFKLNYLSQLIDEILSKWNQENIDDFLSHAKTGKLENAEMDAISARQLDADYQRLKKLLNSIERR